MYIATDAGWLDLAGYKDIFTGEIVGYAMSKRMTKGIQALFQAASAKRPKKVLILHSDCGSQYCSYAFARALNQFAIKVSTSRKGNCYDNASIVRFWGTLKTEMVNHRKYAAREEAEAEISEYLEIFYNRQRIQKSWGIVRQLLLRKSIFQKEFGRKVWVSLLTTDLNLLGYFLCQYPKSILRAKFGIVLTTPYRL